VRCTNLANCQVGQAGPGGGPIVYAVVTGGFGTYWELAPAGWAGIVGRDPLMSSSDAVRAAKAYSINGLSDWDLPPSYVIDDVCHYAAGDPAGSKEACANNSKIKGQFGDGSNKPESSYYWYYDSGTTVYKNDFVSGRHSSDTSKQSYVRPARMFTYSPPTTTTTVPPTCATGGRCAIGDISPSGNLIVDIAWNGSSIDMTEMAVKSWNPSLQTPGSNDDPKLTRADAGVKASAFRSGSNWHLPTITEMRAAYLYFQMPVFNASCADVGSTSRPLTSTLYPFRISGKYWVYDPTAARDFTAFDVNDGAAYYDANYYSTPWGQKVDTTTNKYFVRPFRTVRYTGPTMSVASYYWNPSKCRSTYAPTTTTTTMPATCVQGGLCKVGDIGPNGGYIIYVNTAVTDGPEYTEMQRVSSSSQDCNGYNGLDRCTMRPWNNGTYTAPFGNFPTLTELLSLQRNAKLRSDLKMRDSYYWTNKYLKTNGTLTSDFTGGLSDLAQNLEINSFEEAVGVNVSNAKVDSLSMAYFRGVLRWKCYRACVKP
jgi:hypothetical protein